MKVAFVCDWLTGMRGGERCLEAMCQVYPQARIYTLVYYPEKFDGQFDAHEITTSFIQKLPGNDKSFRRYLPIFPKAMESFDLRGYDFVLSFSHCVAKGVKVPKPIPHICYCHTPMRYVWDMRDAYLSALPKMKQPIAKLILNQLRRWDMKTSTRPDHYVANSNFVKARIQRNYGLNSTVIYPPVDCSRFSLSNESEGYYLVLSALVPYKRVDIAVKAFSKMKKTLLVVGQGSELDKLKEMAGGSIEFVSKATDIEVEHFLSRAKALVFPGVEDFGIVPVEAQACGKAVIALGKGGALETVNGLDRCLAEKATGVFFYEQTSQALADAVAEFEQNIEKFSPQTCRENAKKFDRQRYQKQMTEFIEARL